MELQIAKGNPGPSQRRLKELGEELDGWREEAEKLRKLGTVAENAAKTKRDIIPDLEEKVSIGLNLKAAAQTKVDKVGLKKLGIFSGT